MKIANKTGNGQLAPQGQPLGGWLALVAFGLIISPLLVAGNIRINLYEAQDRKLGFSADAREFLIGASILEGLFLVLQVYTAVLFFRRRKSAPTAVIALLVVNFVLSAIIAGWAYHVNPASEGSLQNAVMALLVGGIWITYFLKSTRVKETFVR